MILFGALIDGTNVRLFQNGAALRLYGASTSYVGLAPPATGDGTTYILPVEPGDEGNALVLGSGNQLEFADLGAGSSPDLGDLGDVVITTPSTGQALIYNAGTWENSAVVTVLNDLTDVAINTPSDGQVLVYSGGGWGNAGLASSQITFGDIATDTSTGMKVATAANQKLGFYGATPIAQPSSSDQGSITPAFTPGSFSSLAFSADPTLQGQLNDFRDTTAVLSDDVVDMMTLLLAIRSALVDAGIIKGGA